MSRRESRRGRATGFAAVARRVLLALVAVPRQIVVVVRSAAGRGSGFARSSIGLLLAFLVNVAALFIVFVVARAIYYPFWAAGASPEQLDQSWGGPSAVGATLVHWLVAAAVMIVSYAVILVLGPRVPKGP
jgi:hypothetical protein